jgi:cytochrome P450
MYSIDDPEAAKVIYNRTNVWPKTGWYYAWSHPDPDKSNIFAERDNKEAQRMRRAFNPAFTMTAVLTYEPHVDECGKLLDRKLREFAVAGDVINLGHWILCYAFDIQGLVTVCQLLPTLF